MKLTFGFNNSRKCALFLLFQAVSDGQSDLPISPDCTTVVKDSKKLTNVTPYINSENETETELAEVT